MIILFLAIVLSALSSSLGHGVTQRYDYNYTEFQREMSSEDCTIYELATPIKGASASFGVIFDAQVLDNDIMLESISFRSSKIRGSTIHYWIYIKKGGYNGYESNSNNWEKLAEGSTTSRGRIKFTPVPMENFESQYLSAHTTYSVYVTLNTTDIIYDKGTIEGSTYVQDTGIKVLEGLAVAEYPPFNRDIFRPRLFEGILHYSIKRECTVSPSVAPSVLPSTNPTNIPSAFPSIFPSKGKTKFPSIVPSLLPSIKPTIFLLQTSVNFLFLIEHSLDAKESNSTLNDLSKTMEEYLENEFSINPILMRYDLQLRSVTSSFQSTEESNNNVHQCVPSGDGKACSHIASQVNVIHTEAVTNELMRHYLLSLEAGVLKNLDFIKQKYYVGPVAVMTQVGISFQGTGLSEWKESNKVKALENILVDSLNSNFASTASNSSLQITHAQIKRQSHEAFEHRRALLGPKERAHITAHINVFILLRGEYIPIESKLDFHNVIKRTIESSRTEILSELENQGFENIIHIEVLEKGQESYVPEKEENVAPLNTTVIDSVDVPKKKKNVGKTVGITFLCIFIAVGIGALIWKELRTRKRKQKHFKVWSKSLRNNRAQNKIQVVQELYGLRRK